MANAKKSAKRRGQIAAFGEPPILPTNEVQHFHAYRPTSIKVDGNKQPRAVIRRVVIYRELHDVGKISERHFKAAHHYRNYFDMTERSLTKSCLDVGIRGVKLDHDISAWIIDAQRVVADGLRAVGSLYDVFTLIIENDMTLNAAAAQLHGTRDVMVKGKPKVRVKSGSEQIVLLELKFALERLASVYDL